jgi:acyl-CoA synthetase (AMP-forming)/AMP-acid ligase II
MTDPIGTTATTTRRPENNIISLLEDRAAEHPTRRALVWADLTDSAGAYASMTYADLSRQSAAVAAGLKAGGLRQGDRVFIFVPMVAELYLTLFGVLRIGAVAVFLDSWARRDQLSQCAQQVEPRGFVGPTPAHHMINGVPGFEDVVVSVRVGPGDAGDTSLQSLVDAGAAHAIAPVLPTDSALVTFTTGSSGEPKGADRTHGFLAAQHTALSAELPYAAADIDLPVFPIFSLNNLAAGVTTVLPDVDLAAPSEEDGARLLRQLTAVGATCATLSPSLLRGVTAAARDAVSLPGLRRVVTGGAPVSRDDVEAFDHAFPDAELQILYGSTEVEPIAHLLARDMPPVTGQGVCLGHPSDALDLRFIRPTRGPVALSRNGWADWDVDPVRGGELLVAGPHVCPGYFRNPDAFARAKVVDPDGRAWHRTGDVCLRDEHGRLWMLGRVHNAIRRDGDMLFPVEAELIMNRLPFIARSAYIAMPHAELHEAAWALFTSADGQERPGATDEVRIALANGGIPVDRVMCVPEIPLDPRHHSKVDVDALRHLLLSDLGGHS